MVHEESTVSPSTPIPPGYDFLAKGNVYMTALCRRMTHAANQKLYVVTKNRKVLGLRAPKQIIGEVSKEERATREKRKAKVDKQDDAKQDEFAAAIRKGFGNIPEKEIAPILRRALKKRSGRVGRTGTLSVQDKARFAVVAHIRHGHTKYDSLLRAKTSREQARSDVKNDIRRIQLLWGGALSKKTNTRPGSQKVRKITDATKGPQNLRSSGDGVNTTTQVAPSKPKRKKKRRNKGHETRSGPNKDARNGSTEVPESFATTTGTLKRNQEKPLREPRNLRSLRGANSSQRVELEILDIFSDDEDEPIVISDDSDEVDDEMELDMLSDEFIVDDDEEDPEEDWSSDEM